MTAIAPLQVPPIQRFSLSTKKDAKGKTKVLKLVSASKEPPTVFDMAPVWFRLCCALLDSQRDDSVQTLRDMNRISNAGISISCNDLNIGALASLQVTAQNQAHGTALIGRNSSPAQGIDAVTKDWTYRLAISMIMCLLLKFFVTILVQQEQSHGRRSMCRAYVHAGLICVCPFPECVASHFSRFRNRRSSRKLSRSTRRFASPCARPL